MTPVRNQSLHVVLWIGQLALAAMFALTGIMKVTAPMTQLTEQLVWPGDLPPVLVRFIGLCELTAAVGLVLPALTLIQPGLTPMAAVGLTVLMALAALFHVARGEFNNAAVTVALGTVAAVVAWGRLTRAPFTSGIRI
jgi:putative oxidoreductase